MQPSCGPTLATLLDPRLFRALSDPTRLKILLRLAQCPGPCTVTAAADCCSVDLSVVSRHLAILHQAGILVATKDGRTMSYTVRYGELSRALRAIADAIDACCPEGDSSPAGCCSKSPPNSKAAQEP